MWGKGRGAYRTLGCFLADLKARRKTAAVKLELTTTSCAARVQRSSEKSNGILVVNGRERGSCVRESWGGRGGGMPIEAAEEAALRSEQLVWVVAVEHDFGLEAHEGHVAAAAAGG